LCASSQSSIHVWISSLRAARKKKKAIEADSLSSKQPQQQQQQQQRLSHMSLRTALYVARYRTSLVFPRSFEPSDVCNRCDSKRPDCQLSRPNTQPNRLLPKYGNDITYALFSRWFLSFTLRCTIQLVCNSSCGKSSTFK